MKVQTSNINYNLQPDQDLDLIQSKLDKMITSDLVGEDLSYLDLSHSTFDRVEFDCALLKETNLKNSALNQISFFSADLEGVKLSQAQVNQCDFRYANLEKAELDGVDFSNSKVKGAIFTDATGLSIKQKRWLKANGALNVDLNINSWESLNGNRFNFFKQLKTFLILSN